MVLKNPIILVYAKGNVSQLYRTTFLFTPVSYQQGSTVCAILLYITSRGLCCNIIVLNVYSPTAVKNEYINNNYAKLEQAIKATTTSAWCLPLRFCLLLKSSKNKSPISMKFHQNQYKTQCKILHLELQNLTHSI